VTEMGGNGNDVLWDSFDRRAKAKASNDVVAPEEGGEDMFTRARVAAE